MPKPDPIYNDPTGEFVPFVVAGAFALYKMYTAVDTVNEVYNTATDTCLSTPEKALLIGLAIKGVRLENLNFYAVFSTIQTCSPHRQTLKLHHAH
jgi:hypothetical protein